MLSLNYSYSLNKVKTKTKSMVIAKTILIFIAKLIIILHCTQA